MTEAETVAERYLRSFDRMACDDSAIDELLALFEDDATVELFEGQQPIAGRDALRELYAGFGSQLVESRHFWRVEHADAQEVELRWVQASRWVDGRLVARSGVERITIDAAGLITRLRNRRVTPDEGR